MDCTGVAHHLLAYRLGTLEGGEGGERDAIDAHLLDCRACLEAYLALKRATEARPLERPSAEARARLRGAVAARFGGGAPAARVSFFGRRIPLYQGLAFAAVAAALALAVPRLLGRDAGGGARPFARSEHAAGGAEVDTSRASAASFTIY